MNSRIDKIWDLKEWSRETSDKMIILSICCFCHGKGVVDLEGAISGVWLHKDPPLIITWEHVLFTTGGSQSVAFCLHVQLSKKPLSTFHSALFDLDFLGWSPLFKKIVSLRFPGFFLHIQCEPQNDLNPGHIFRDNGKLQLECSKAKFH